MSGHSNTDDTPNAAFAEQLVDAIGAVVWEYDWTAERYTFVSEGAFALLGYPASDWYTTPFWSEHVHPEDVDWVTATTDEETQRRKPHDLEYRMLHRDGSVVWVREIVTPHIDPDGRVRQRGIAIDITARKVAEQTARAETDHREREHDAAVARIRESEQQFRSIVERAPFGLHFYRLNETGDLVFAGCNPAADLMSRDHTQHVGMPVGGLPAGVLGPEDAFEACRRIAAEGGTWTAEREFSRGGVVLGVYEMNVFQTSPGTAALAFVDITERRRQEEREAQYKERLSALSAELAVAEDRERRRLAEELHDRVSQALAVARMHLGAALDRAPEKIEEASASLALIDEAIREARAITTELYPPVLGELGVGVALHWLGERLYAQYGLECTVVVEDPIHVGDDVSAFLFRSARELLGNVVKYAGTMQAWVSLDRVDGQIVLTVADQGVGFDPESPEVSGDNGGFGLFSIRERTRYFGGTFELESAPGQGTRATVTVPA